MLGLFDQKAPMKYSKINQKKVVGAKYGAQNLKYDIEKF